MRLQLAFALAVGFSVTAAQAAEPLQSSPLPIEAIAEHPAISGVTLSPDGKHMAALVGSPKHKWPVISIWETDNLSKPPVWIPSDKMRPRLVSFVGNDHVIFFADQPFTYASLKTFTVQAVVSDLQGKNFSYPFAAKGTLSEFAKEIERFGVNFSIFQDGSIENPDRSLISFQYTGQSGKNLKSIDAVSEHRPRHERNLGTRHQDNESRARRASCQQRRLRSRRHSRRSAHGQTAFALDRRWLASRVRNTKSR